MRRFGFARTVSLSSANGYMINKQDFIEERVESLLPDDVQRNAWSSGAGEYVDFVVCGDIVDAYVMVGGDGLSVATLCHAAMMAAQDERHGIPVVIVPTGHDEPTAVRMYRQRGVVVRELEIEPPDFPSPIARVRMREQRIEEDHETDRR